MPQTTETFLQPATELVPDEYRTVDYWDKRIRLAMDKEADAVFARVLAYLEIGRELNEAAKYLGSGKGSLFAVLVKDRLKIDLRMAQKYMRFAKNAVLRDEAVLRRLPAAIDTIDKLGIHDGTDLYKMVDDGVIHPQMLRRDVPRLPGTPPPKVKPRESVAMLRQEKAVLADANQELEERLEKSIQRTDGVQAIARKLIADHGLAKAKRAARRVLAEDDDDLDDQGDGE